MRLFRLERAFSAASGVLITGIIVGSLDEVSLVHGFAALSVFFSALTNFVLNDLHDLDSDKVNGRLDRPIAAGVIEKDTALLFAIISGVLAVGFAFQIPLDSRHMILVGLPVTLLYNIFLKRFIVFKNLFTGFANSGVVLVGASITGSHLDPLVLFLAVLGFFFSLSYEIMLDIADIEGDRGNGVSTVPVRFDIGTAVRLSIVFGLVTVIMAPMPYFIELDARLVSDPFFILLVGASILDRLRIMKGLWSEQSPEKILKLKTSLFRNLQLSGLSFLFGILL